ncbi:hypothetical protein [Verrucosispora sp. WMMD573]|uniref:DivIVA domain-containing protein n=1 Tax=Verrucosispora sp. WMMD573 TaxID=3015149 RepID=UPI00248BC9EE|nr:hypothetical protein [Verrucosispora sp. WMMD573]WBB53959.1 hypothetical protein O7601_25975 [Verrucosispora sp. WMMD573]
MRKPAKTAAVLVGLGVGVAIGPSLGPAAVWSGIAIAVLGGALCLIGTTESGVAGDGPVDRDEETGVAGDGPPTGTTAAAPRRRNRQRPNLGGLGTRVEQILKLAEEQANDHRDEARRESEAIVTAARREAEAILNRAHEQAARITANHRDPSSTRSAAPNGNPSPPA